MENKIQELLELSEQLDIKIKQAIDVYKDPSSSFNYQKAIETLYKEKQKLSEENEKLKLQIMECKEGLEKAKDELVSLRKIIEN